MSLPVFLDGLISLDSCVNSTCSARIGKPRSISFSDFVLSFMYFTLFICFCFVLAETLLIVYKVRQKIFKLTV